MDRVLSASTFWRHPVFRRLGDLERTIALYLYDGPQANKIGLYPLSVRQVAEDLDRDLQDVRAALEGVLQATNWPFDQAKAVILLPAWWAWKLPNSEGEFKRRLLADLPVVVPRGTPLTDQFFASRRYVPPPWHPVLDDMATRKWNGVARVATVVPAEQPFLLESGIEPAPFSVQIVDVWNATVQRPIPKVKWTRERGAKVDQRRKVLKDLREWQMAIHELAVTPWCRGEGRDEWYADFDFFVRNDTNVLRFYEKAALRDAVERRPVQTHGVPNCNHEVPCKTMVECTRKYLSGEK